MMNHNEETKVLICCTGSVATTKLEELLSEFKYRMKCQLRVCITENTVHMLPSSCSDELYRDSDQWQNWKKLGDPVLHIELAKWADIVCIAPLDANTLGKLASGIADNLVTTVVRAFPVTKPLFFCPAMNTTMWEHPITQEQVRKLQTWNYKLIMPTTKLLACGDYGIGGMEEPEEIVGVIIKTLAEPFTS